jgi:hypothetical protein
VLVVRLRESSLLVGEQAKPPNCRAAITERRALGALAGTGPTLMLFSRSVLAVIAHGLVAAIYAVHGSKAAWHDAERWMAVYGSVIDLGCLAGRDRTDDLQRLRPAPLSGTVGPNLACGGCRRSLVVIPASGDAVELQALLHALSGPIADALSSVPGPADLRVRRVVPLAIAQWLMDGGDALGRTLWPLLV